jgi:CheY-like chemotaxis protein
MRWRRRNHRFDLVLSDLGLPDMTGHELMKRIKRDGQMAIAMSGFGIDEDHQAQSAGRF